MFRHKTLLLSAIAVPALLSACAAEDSSAFLPPPLVDYPAAFQARAAEELEALPPACPLHAPGDDCSGLARLIEDYGELRARVRAR